MSKSDIPCGVLLIDKPAGITSHDVVDRVRALPKYQGSKVGHAGTLDPFATGLLMVLVGRATRVQQYLVGLPKGYRATARFGATSTTLDRDGEISSTGASVEEQAVREQLAALTGTYEQSVPMTSAVKVKGERLYKKARRGETIETPKRTITIERADLVSFDATGQLAEIEVECSSGTYIRQLVSDLGERCGAGAYCDALQRTAIGDFALEQADERRLVGLSEALSFLPERLLDDDEVARVANGVAIEPRMDVNGSPIRLSDRSGLVALAEVREGMLKPATIVRPA